MGLVVSAIAAVCSGILERFRTNDSWSHLIHTQRERIDWWLDLIPQQKTENHQGAAEGGIQIFTGNPGEIET